MLVLSRKEGERINIGPDIVLTVVSIKGQTIRLGFEAPVEVNIRRTEIRDNRPQEIRALKLVIAYLEGRSDCAILLRAFRQDLNTFLGFKDARSAKHLAGCSTGLEPV